MDISLLLTEDSSVSELSFPDTVFQVELDIQDIEFIFEKRTPIIE